MHSKHNLFVALAAAGTLLAGCSGGSMYKGPSLGYLDHRGQAYQIRDLMDPQYRAESSDRFARGFEPNITFARFNDASFAPSALRGLE